MASTNVINFDDVPYLDGKGPSNNAISFDDVPMAPMPMSSVIKRAWERAIPDFSNYATQFIEALSHPIDTAMGMGKLGLGLTQYGLPPAAQAAVEIGDHNYKPYVDEVVDSYAQKYPSVEGAKRQFAEHPVETLGDLSMVLGLGSGGSSLAGATKTAKALSKASAATDPLRVPFTAYGGAKAVSHGVDLPGGYKTPSIPVARDTFDVIDAVGGAAKDLSKRFTPEGLYLSALKLPSSYTVEDKLKIARDLIKRGIPITEDALLGMDSTVSSLHKKVMDVLGEAKKRGEQVSPLPMVENVWDTYENWDTATPTSSQSPIRRFERELWKDNFEDKGLGAPIDMDPVTAQLKKSNTYKQYESAYARENAPSSTHDAAKAAARGLKEELERVAPEVKPLNDEMATLIPAWDAVNHSLGRAANWNLLGIGGLGGALTSNPAMAVGTETIRNPGFLSRMGIVGNRLGQYGQYIPTDILSDPVIRNIIMERRREEDNK